MLSLVRKFTTALSFCEVCNQPVEQGSNRNVWINASEFSKGFWKKNVELFCQERNTAFVADSFSWHFTALFFFFLLHTVKIIYLPTNAIQTCSLDKI